MGGRGMTETITFEELTSRAPSRVSRWHSKPTLQQENIAEHQWYVGYQAYVMTWLLASREWDVVPEVALLFGMMHDMAEIVTGDLPGPFKRRPEVDPVWADWEQEIVSHMFEGASESLAHTLQSATSMVPDEADDELWEVERSIAIFCDKLSAYAFIVQEVEMGNTLAAVLEIRQRRALVDYGSKFEWWDAICEAVPDLLQSLPYSGMPVREVVVD